MARTATSRRGDNVFSYNATVARATPLGAKSLPVTIARRAGARLRGVDLAHHPVGLRAAAADRTSWPPPGNLQVCADVDTRPPARPATTSSAPPSAAVRTSTHRPERRDRPTTPTPPSRTARLLLRRHRAERRRRERPVERGQRSARRAAAGRRAAKIYFVDIGQGASTLIVSPTGKTLLVDGGPTGQGNAKIVPLLDTLGITTIDYTVAHALPHRSR